MEYLRSGHRNHFRSGSFGAALLLALAAAASGCSQGVRGHHNIVAIGVSCSKAVNAGHRLTAVHKMSERLPGSPFGIVTTSNGRWSFVALGKTISVIRNDLGRSREFRVVSLPLPPQAEVAGEYLTPDGRTLLLASGDGAFVVNVASLESGKGASVVGKLKSGELGASAVQVVSTQDGRFVFVAFEGFGSVGVFDLSQAFATKFRASSFVRSIPLGNSVVGLAMSKDGRWLYATSEEALDATASKPFGTLSVISTADAVAKIGPGAITSVPAGCDPVRVVVSPDGLVVWVTARESNSVLAFSVNRLLRSPKTAILAAVAVGSEPVGIAFVEHGRRLIVADSNRFEVPGATSAYSVIDPKSALEHRPAVLGSISAGGFPRELSGDPLTGTLLATNFASMELEVVDLNGLP